MTRRAVKKRSKPAVADQNSIAAAENIAVKLAFLRRLTESAQVDSEFASAARDALPTSRTKFNNWKSTSVPRGLLAPPFGSNAPKTLRGDTLLSGSVDAAVAAVKRLKLAPLPEKGGRGKGKLETIADLTREVKLVKAMKQIAERELLRFQARVKDLEDEITALKAADASRTREFQRALGESRRPMPVKDVTSPTKAAKVIAFDKAADTTTKKGKVAEERGTPKV